MIRSSRSASARAVIVFVLASLALAACAPSSADSERASEPSVAAPADGRVPDPAPADGRVPDPGPTTTSVPAGGRQPDAEDPLRVLFTGDSIGVEVAAPVMAAIGGGGSAVTYFVANPSIPRDPARKALWEARLAKSDPEVIVVLVGVWERMGFGEEQLAGQTVTQYRAEVIDPFIDLVTSQGAELVWVSSPLVEDVTASRQIGFLDEAFRTVGQSDDRVEFIDAAGLVAGPDGEFVTVTTGLGGQPERVRRVDGTHLCPGGAVLMAAPLVEYLTDRWNVPVDPDWPIGDWRSAMPFENAAIECPAAG